MNYSIDMGKSHISMMFQIGMKKLNNIKGLENIDVIIHFFEQKYKEEDKLQDNPMCCTSKNERLILNGSTI